jgi:hypothetical protein
MEVVGDKKAATAVGSGATKGDAVDSRDLQQQSKALHKLTDHVEDWHLRLLPNPFRMFLVNSTLSL